MNSQPKLEMIDGVSRYEHLDNEPIALRIIWADEPGFYDADGRYDLSGEYDEHPEYGPYRLVDDSEILQPDEISLTLAHGRKTDSTSGRDLFRFNDADWVDLTGYVFTEN